MAEREGEKQVEALREELRRLGYLDSRWERFFLEGLTERVGFLSVSVKNAVKLGFSGGMLFAILLVLGTLQTVPELAREPMDLLVLGFYFTIASALGIAGVALLAAFAVHALHRAGVTTGLRIEPVARAFGVFFGLASLTYSSLWWRSHVPAGGEWSGASLALLGLCVLVSLAVGRFSGLALLGALARSAFREQLKGPVLARRKVVPLALAGGLLYVAVFLVLTRRPAVAETVAASPYRIAETSLRVRFIGLDGLALDMVESMRARGRAPGFDALSERAAVFRLGVLPDRVPSLLWTSLATGQAASGHGVRAMATERMPGLRTPLQLAEDRSLASALAAMGSVFRVSEPRPLTRSLRQVKAIWDILSDQGKAVGVVGWWATWPEDPLRGYVLTDRLFFKLKTGGAFDRETDSEELFARLGASFATDRAEAERALGALPGEVSPELRLAFERDAYHVLIDDRLRREEAPELSMLYLSSLDVASMKLLGGPSGPPDLARASASAHVLESTFRFFDRVIAQALSELKADEVLVVVTEPGRLPSPAPGALYLVGAPVRAGHAESAATLYDVAPTLLYLLGFPSSREMPGKVLDAALPKEALAARAPEQIATFGSRRQDPTGLRPTAFDREMLEQLRALGYIQ